MTSDDTTNDATFSTVDIDRRTFTRLAAATAGALALPGSASADVSSDAMTDEYRYVVNHTADDYAVPTLATFTDESGLDALTDIAPDARTTTEPRPAGYAQLTASQSAAVADLPTAEELSHSPGSNPFWRLGYYPLGVFPEPERSTGFVDYEQMIDGLAHLHDQHPDRTRFYSIGQSPGHYNEVTARNDPKDVYTFEVTNDIDDGVAFAEKEKVFYSLSLHGLERAGAEAGSRFIERLLRGNEREVKSLLDEVVLIFCYTNPDGWVAKHPQYESGWQLAGPDGGAPVAPFYERGNAGVYDTNRQYPTVGWITPAHYPGEPRDPAERSEQRVTDALAVVEHFRTYENLNYGADMHGALNSSEFVLGLISQDQFDARDLHELYEMNRVIDADLEDALETWTTAGDLQEVITGDFNPAPLGFGTLPEEAFDYAGIWDTIGYTVSGAMGDWMAHPEELGGLGMTTMDFEMAYSHMVGANVYNPELVRMQVTGYQTAIRTIADYAVRNSDTPNTDDEFDIVIDTGGEATAYVTSEKLRRSSEELSFLADEGATFTYEGLIGPGAVGTTTVTHTFDTADLTDETRVEAELSWTPAAEDLEFYLENPDGERVAAAATANNPESIATTLEATGEYTFVVETYANAAAEYEITAVFPGATTPTTANSSTSESEIDPLGGTATAFTLESGLHSVTVHPHAHDAVLETELVAPDGTVARSYHPDQEHAVGGRCCDSPEWTVTAPEPGTWTLRTTNHADEAGVVEVQVATLAAPAEASPDPRDALGYDQQAYDVTPLRFFEEYADAADGPVEPVSVADVKSGALDGYDNVVVVHDDGRFDAEYVDALDAYADAGGNLVLTDSGVNLLGPMRNALATGMNGGSISREEFYIANLAEKDLDHPLLQDVRPIQKALWKIAPLGYSTGNEAPMHLLDPDGFRMAGANGATVSIAATTDSRVSAGSLTPTPEDSTGIHVVSSLLPPASQANLHPFGLLDHTVSFLGYLALTNALGFSQVRTAGGDVTTFGGGEFSVDPEPVPFSVDGTRSDDGSAFTGGQTNHVRLSVTPSRDAAVRDTVPSDWTVLTDHSPDVTRVETSGGETHVHFGTVPGGETTDVEYFVEAPGGLSSSNSYEFGPLEANPGERWVAVAGTTETNTVAGVDTDV